MTDSYALFGHPVSHSKSPQIHLGFAKALGHDISYRLIDAEPGQYGSALGAFKAAGGVGCNVTAPYKVEAYELADVRLARAEQAGSANCLKFEPDGRVVAEMFDGVGLARDIEHNLGIPLRGKRVLMLGAGGAARGALPALLGCGTHELVVANRTPDRAAELARRFGTLGTVTACGYDDLAGQRFDVVLNGTSAGLHGDLPPLPASLFSNTQLAYEMVYGKGLTPFLRHARQGGATRVVDGVGMLVEQAAEAWVWWRGVRPPTQELIKQISVPLT
jgi:shikimate dehydrogenase